MFTCSALKGNDAYMNLLQVKGQRTDQRKQKVKRNENKQEVEIRHGMTAEALAAAMNKDFGKNSQNPSMFLIPGDCRLKQVSALLKTTSWRLCSTPLWTWTLYIQTPFWRRGGSRKC